MQRLQELDAEHQIVRAALRVCSEDDSDQLCDLLLAIKAERAAAAAEVTPAVIQWKKKATVPEAVADALSKARELLKERALRV